MNNHLGDTNKMVDTPRTEAHIEGLRRNPQVSGCDSTLDFSRQLERELNAANERIKRMEEGGDKAILNSYLPDRLEVWHKAKEVKP